MNSTGHPYGGNQATCEIVLDNPTTITLTTVEAFFTRYSYY